MARPQHTADEIEATRDRLVELALDLSLREGIEALSLRRLAELAGISHTLPYRYFENKESLVVALRIACIRHFDQFVRSYEDPAASGITQVRNVASAYVDFVRQHPGEYQLIFTTQQPPPDAYPDLLAARRRLFDHAVAVLQAAVDGGELLGNPLELAHLLWVSLHGLMTLHVAGQLVHGLRLEQLVDPLVDGMIGMARGGPSVARKPPRSSARRLRR